MLLSRVAELQSVMGGCVGTQAGARRGSGSGSALSDSSVTPATRNKPLRSERVRWKSDIPLTDGQLMSKRDEFWDTAPAFEGKTEIWVALRAAVEAITTSEDLALAQAILDGAGISLPGGSLVEAYDEWGTRYSIPVYCLSNPLNLLTNSDRDSPAEFSEPCCPASATTNTGEELKVKVRISLTGEDVRLVLNTAETVGLAKKKLSEQENIAEPAQQRWYFGGKLLGDKLKMGEVGAPQGFVIQCIVNSLEFDVITSPKD